MKLKTYHIERPIIETDIDLPVYFHLQSEGFDEDFIKIDKNGKTIIKRSYSELTITYTANDFSVPSHYINRSETNKKHYDEALRYALKQFRK